MKKTKNRTNQADLLRLEETKPPRQLYTIGRTINMSEEEIDRNLQRKGWIQSGILLFTATLLATFSYLVYSSPAHYKAVSIDDFNTLGQMMYTMFGRIF